MLIYNVLLVSSMWQTDSILYTYMYIYIILWFSSLYIITEILSMVPSLLCSSILLVVYFTYSSEYMLNPNFNLSLLLLFSFGNLCFVFYVSLFYFLNAHFITFFLYSPYKPCNMIFVFVWLTSLSIIISRSIYIGAMALLHSFMAGVWF